MQGAALATLIGAVAALGTPAPALGAPPAPPTTPAPQPAPAPAPQAGKLRLEVVGGQPSHGRTYVLTGDTVSVFGHVKPYVPGQTIRVPISAPHRRPARV